MSKALWLVAGVAIGFVAAHQVSRTEQGRAFFDDISDRARDFGASVVDGYRSRESELRDAVASAEDAIADLSKRLS